MDLKHLNPMKNKVTLLIKTFNIFYKKQTQESVHDSVSNSGNRLIKSLYDAMDNTVNVVDDYTFFRNRKRDKSDNTINRYRDMIRNPAEFILNIPNVDSAYQDLLEYTMYNWLKGAIETDMLSYLESKVKKPEHFYFNAWQNIQKETHDKKEKGLLLDEQLCESEYMLVDKVNSNNLQQFHKKQVDIQKKNQHW